MRQRQSYRLRVLGLLFLLLLGIRAGADEKIYPDRPNPPRLVNDFAGMMSPQEQDQLERKLEDFARTTSNQITIVTIKSLGDYDVSDYAIQLGKRWGVGKSGKNNGVVVLASLDEHKINISTGKGLEGALTDLTCGQIIRKEMVPSFRSKNYFEGFSKGADAIIAATKGEYKADASDSDGGRKHIPATGIIILVIFILFILRIIRGGGGGGGNYMSGKGFGGFATGWLLGNMLGGGGRGWGGGGDSGGGGFGGFGGGDFGGGGASGSW